MCWRRVYTITAVVLQIVLSTAVGVRGELSYQTDLALEKVTAVNVYTYVRVANKL